MLEELPSYYIEFETQHMVAVYFCVIGLDMLGALDTVDKEKVIEHVYSMQVVNTNEKGLETGGFRSGSCFGTPPSPEERLQHIEHDASMGVPYIDFWGSHIASTYSAICILLTLKDDLSRLHSQAILNQLTCLQQDNGCFGAISEHGENEDVRFVFCACAIAFMLDDYSTINTHKASLYVKSCLSYEGGLGLSPWLEAQGGASYCGLAALLCIDTLHDTLSKDQLQLFTRWCYLRATNNESKGYTGRVGKKPDSCYSFWVGGCLQLLDQFHLTNPTENRDFLLNKCQHARMGGFSKHAGGPPDVLHTFYSLAWLSMDIESRESLGLTPIDPKVGWCRRDCGDGNIAV